MDTDSQPPDTTSPANIPETGKQPGRAREGQLAVVCETVVTIHQPKEAGTDQQSWEVVDYGIPAVVSRENQLRLCVGDIETGEVVREFPLESTADYSMRKEYFHVLTCSKRQSEEQSTAVYGLSFTDANVANKLLKVVKQLAPPDSRDDSAPPAAKQPKLSESEPKIEDWVIVRPEDVPADEVGKEQPDEEDEEGSEGSMEEGEEEEVDAAFGTLRRSLRRKKHKVAVAPKEGPAEQGKKAISGPMDFKHLTHVDTQSTVGQLKAVLGGDETPTDTTPTPSMETVESELSAEAPVVEPQPPEPPREPEEEPMKVLELEEEPHFPAAVGSSSTTASTSVPAPPTPPAPTHVRVPSATRIPSVPKIAHIVPDPPPLSDHETLLQEITQFDRKQLRPVDREQIAQTRNMPDSLSEHADLNSLLRSGLERMRSKLQLSFSRMVSVGSMGDDDFDDFDFSVVPK